MLSTYYLKSDTAEQLQAALQSAGLCIESEGGDVSFYGECDGFILDWIGEIFEPTGAVLDEGTDDERPEMVSVGGYHCNIYSEKALPESLAEFQLAGTPATPARKLSGT